MKVTIVVGGRWHAIDLARELHQAGYLHRLITNYPKFKTRQWGVPDDKVVSLPLTLLLNRGIAKVGGDPLMRKSLPLIYNLFAQSAARHLEESTLIHGWSSVAEPSLHWAKQQGVPFVLERSSSHITVQSHLLEEEYGKLGLVCTEVHSKIVEQELQEYALADRIAVPSLFAKRSFLQQGYPEQNLIYNPFGTNLNTFSPGKKQDDVFRVVYAGVLSVRKGIHHLVRAFMKVNIPNSELCLLGAATPETPKLLEGADDRVKCIGHVPEIILADYYRNSSVFAMPSIEDGFGYVVAQALACGLPLICTTNTGGEDLLSMQDSAPVARDAAIAEYSAGYIIQPGNSEAIADLLELLASDPDLLEQKRQAALNFPIQNLSWKQYTRRMIEHYREIGVAPSGKIEQDSVASQEVVLQ
jgi:glycosyltransferase involved in cell wall biosynthesis